MTDADRRRIAGLPEEPMVPLSMVNHIIARIQIEMIKSILNVLPFGIGNLIDPVAIHRAIYDTVASILEGLGMPVPAYETLAIEGVAPKPGQSTGAEEVSDGDQTEQ